MPCKLFFIHVPITDWKLVLVPWQSGTSILANSEDPDEMLQNAAFLQGLPCLLRHPFFRDRKKYIILELQSVTPSNVKR